MTPANFDHDPEFLMKLNATQEALDKADQHAESVRAAAMRAQRDRGEKLAILMRQAEEVLQIAKTVAALAANHVRTDTIVRRDTRSLFRRPAAIQSGWRVFSQTKDHSSYGLGKSGGVWNETNDIILASDGSLYRCHYRGEPIAEVVVQDGPQYFSRLEPNTVTAWGYWSYQTLDPSYEAEVLDNGRLSGEVVFFNPPGIPLPTGPERGIAEVQDGLAKFVLRNSLNR